ncbi:YoaK family protein [Pseudoalteromonas sp. B137]
MKIKKQHLFESTGLSFLAGFVDTLGFVALFGLFTAHVTGNFVLIGASITRESNSALLIKFMAFPAFIAGIAIIRLLVVIIPNPEKKPLVTGIAIGFQLLFLLGFMFTGLAATPIGNEQTPFLIFCGMLGAIAMGMHSAYTRLLMTHLPPTSMMTGNVTQIVLDFMELMLGRGNEYTWERINKFSWPVIGFATGAIGSAYCYLSFGFWALLIPIFILVSLLFIQKRYIFSSVSSI